MNKGLERMNGKRGLAEQGNALLRRLIWVLVVVFPVPSYAIGGTLSMPDPCTVKKGDLTFQAHAMDFVARVDGVAIDARSFNAYTQKWDGPGLKECSAYRALRTINDLIDEYLLKQDSRRFYKKLSARDVIQDRWLAHFSQAFSAPTAADIEGLAQRRAAAALLLSIHKKQISEDEILEEYKASAKYYYTFRPAISIFRFFVKDKKRASLLLKKLRENQHKDAYDARRRYQHLFDSSENRFYTQAELISLLGVSSEQGAQLFRPAKGFEMFYSERLKGWNIIRRGKGNYRYGKKDVGRLALDARLKLAIKRRLQSRFMEHQRYPYLAARRKKAKIQIFLENVEFLKNPK